MIKPWHEFFRIRERVPAGRAVFLGCLLPAALFAAWYWATAGEIVEERVVSQAVLPSPGELFGSFPHLWTQRKLPEGVLHSLRRVALGFLVGGAAAVPLGVAMGAFPRVKALFLPFAIVGAYTPIAALVPLTFMWFGIEETQKVMFLAIATFVYLLPLVWKAVETVDDVYLETAATLGATRWQQVGRVLVPVALAEIWTALRLGFAVGWAYIILAEMVDAQYGLGSLIIVSQRQGPREHVYLVILVIALIGFLLDVAWEKTGRWLFPHKTA